MMPTLLTVCGKIEEVSTVSFAQYLLNNNASDTLGLNDGVVLGTVDFQGDRVVCGTGSIGITDGLYYTWWVDIGTGMTFNHSTTKPIISVNNFSNVRVFDVDVSNNITLLTSLLNEGYHPRGNDIQSSEEDDTTLMGLTPPTIDGLIARYHLTGTVEDTTGNYNGVEIGVAYIDDVSRGAAVSFNGVDSYINTPRITNTESVSLWVNRGITNYLYPRRFLIWGDFVSRSEGFMLSIGESSRWYANETLQVYYPDGATYKAKYITTIITDNSWNHVVVQWENNTYEFYINGIKIPSYTYLGTDTKVLENRLGFTVGIGIGVLNSNIIYDNDNGKQMSNVNFYNRPLTLQEIQDTYIYEKNLRSIPIDDGLGSYYPSKNNSLDNNFNQLDATATVGVTYDGSQATIPNGDTITYPPAIGFVEAYYIKDGVWGKTLEESDLDNFTNCTIREVRKYTKALTDGQVIILQNINGV